jgi:hypothetical protein
MKLYNTVRMKSIYIYEYICLFVRFLYLHRLEMNECYGDVGNMLLNVYMFKNTETHNQRGLVIFFKEL